MSRLKINQAGFIKFTKRTLSTYLIVSTVVIGTGLIYLFGPWAKKTEAVWFDDNWGYRKAITAVKIWVIADSAKIKRHLI